MKKQGITWYGDELMGYWSSLTKTLEREKILMASSTSPILRSSSIFRVLRRRVSARMGSDARVRWSSCSAVPGYGTLARWYGEVVWYVQGVEMMMMKIGAGTERYSTRTRWYGATRSRVWR
jgi:hypothetical protein